MAALLVFGVFIFLIIIGVPIASSLGTAAIGAIMNYDLGMSMISRNFEANIDFLYLPGCSWTNQK